MKQFKSKEEELAAKQAWAAKVVANAQSELINRKLALDFALSQAKELGCDPPSWSYILTELKS